LLIAFPGADSKAALRPGAYPPGVPRRDDDENDAIDEGPSDDDLERFSSATRTCPACRTELYDDAELCWKCGHALSSQAAVPRWVLVAGAVTLAAVLLAYALFVW
jgi:hypothetical protein